MPHRAGMCFFLEKRNRRPKDQPAEFRYSIYRVLQSLPELQPGPEFVLELNESQGLRALPTHSAFSQAWDPPSPMFLLLSPDNQARNLGSPPCIANHIVFPPFCTFTSLCGLTSGWLLPRDKHKRLSVSSFPGHGYCRCVSSINNIRDSEKIR